MGTKYKIGDRLRYLGGENLYLTSKLNFLGHIIL